MRESLGSGQKSRSAGKLRNGMSRDSSGLAPSNLTPPGTPMFNPSTGLKNRCYRDHATTTGRQGEGYQ